MSYSPACASLSLLALLVLAGCSAQTATPPASQVAAKVGVGEISVHQLKFLLEQQGDIAPAMQAKATQETLERLIDQELALQQAHTLKLDRDMRVMQALEAARRDIVSRAYLEQVLANVSAPTEDDVKQYINAHPALFSQRRIHDIQELNLMATPDKLNSLQVKVKAARSIDEVLAMARIANVAHEVRQSSLVPESTPPALWERITALTAGQILWLNAPGGAKVIVLSAVRAAPLHGELIAQRAELMLRNERKTQALAQGLKGLRASAPVVYQGAFVAPSAVAVQPASVSASVPASVPGSPTTTALDDSTIHRGLK
jgi:EpsD family peptidyl-prolyl cis-trans isomerase